MPLKGFEPESLSHMLCMPATLGMHSKCDKDTGSNPISGMFGERNMDRGLNPSTFLPTENAKSILENMCLEWQSDWHA